MGFAYSPWLAESVAWAVMIYHSTGQKQFFSTDSFREGHAMPVFVPVITEGRQRGFCVIYYDNYFVAVDDGNLALQISNRIKDNCREWNIAIKGDSEIDKSEGIEPSHLIVSHSDLFRQGVTYLGINIRLNHRKRSRADTDEGHDRPHLQWRLGKIEKWKGLHTDASSALIMPKTLRSVAELCGRLMFHHMLELRPLVSMPNAMSTIDVLRYISKRAYQGTWNDPIDLPDEHQSALLRSWRRATQNPWFRVEQPHVLSKSNPIIASDASRYGFGVVICSFLNDELICDERGLAFEWKDEHSAHADAHIFIQEMYAAIHGIRTFFEKHPDQQHITLVVDNVGVAWSIRNGFCSNMIANSMIQSVREWLPRLTVVCVTSETNVADCPSRISKEPSAYASFEDRRVKLGRVLVDAMEGRTSFMPHASYDAKDPRGLRHAPPADSGADMDSCNRACATCAGQERSECIVPSIDESITADCLCCGLHELRL